MLIKFLKTTLLFPTLFLLISIFILAVDSDLRRGVFEKGVRVFYLHQEGAIRALVHQKRYDAVSDRIMQYIDMSTILSSTRSQLFPEIINVTEFAAERSSGKKELTTLVPVFRRLLKIDPNLYRIRVWLAESIEDLNYSEAMLNIEKAIQLSEVDEKAYRVAIGIAKKNNYHKLAQKYCQRYTDAQLGGQYPRLFYSGFAGSGLREISVKFNNDNQIYSHSGVKLNKSLNYEFIPEKSLDFEELSMFLNVVPGTKIIIDKILLYTDSREIAINAIDFMTTTRSAYDLTNSSTNKLVLISMGNNTEFINMQLNKVVEGVRKINVKMMFSRAPLASKKNLCKS